MSDPRAPNNGQLSKKLPGVTTFVTGHTADGKAVVEAKRPGSWLPYDEDRMAFMQVYTSSFPANLNDKQDLQAHDQLMKSGTLGLVKPGGVVCRQVDMAPGYLCMMHRTQSLDYGVVLEGTVEMILDDDSRSVLRRGDVAVQRATIHAWRNPSETEWTRMLFILQDIQPLVINGKRFGEDLAGTTHIPASGNDV